MIPQKLSNIYPFEVEWSDNSTTANKDRHAGYIKVCEVNIIPTFHRDAVVNV